MRATAYVNKYKLVVLVIESGCFSTASRQKYRDHNDAQISATAIGVRDLFAMSIRFSLSHSELDPLINHRDASLVDQVLNLFGVGANCSNLA